MLTSAGNHFFLRHRHSRRPHRIRVATSDRSRTSASNFAARAGRWSAEHWKAAAAIWLLFVAVAISAGRIAGTHKLADAEYATGEAARAEQILAGAGFKTPASEAVLVRSQTLGAADPAFRVSVRSVMTTLRSMPQVTNLRTGAAGEISRDGHAQLIQFDVRGNADTAYKRVKPLLDAVAGLQRSQPGFTIAEFGQASATKEYHDTLGRDFAHAERLTVPVTFLVLLLAGSKIFTSIGIGTMIVVFTSLVGSLTVLPALLGRLGDRVERGVRQVLAAAVLWALRPLHVQPRLLVWLRDMPTLLRKLKGDRPESRAWAFVLRGSMRFPAVAVALSASLLIVLALPVLSIDTKLPSFTDLPKSLHIVKTYDMIQASFPGSEDPAHVVVKARDVTTPQFKAVYAKTKQRALARA